MDWLKDKKNLPFVVGGAIVLIVGSLTLMLYNLGVFNRSAALPPPPPEVAAAPARPGPGGPASLASPRPSGPAMHGSQMAARPHPGARPGPGGPAASGAAASATPAVGIGPPLTINPAAARDPFNIPIMKHGKMVASIALPPPVAPRPRPRGILPATDYYSYASDNAHTYDVVQPLPPGGFQVNGTLNNGVGTPVLPRVAGVIFIDGVHAIIQYPAGQGQVPGQASGDDQSRSVAPGDTIDGVGRVTAIDADGITVRTAGGSTINIPVTAGSPESGVPGGGVGAPGSPGGPPLGFQPSVPPNPNGNF